MTEGFRELKSWMDANGFGIRKFATHSGLSRNTVFRLVHGLTQSLSVKSARQISRATGGDVGIPEVEAYEARTARAKEKQLATTS